MPIVEIGGPSTEVRVLRTELISVTGGTDAEIGPEAGRDSDNVEANIGRDEYKMKWTKLLKDAMGLAMDNSPHEVDCEAEDIGFNKSGVEIKAPGIGNYPDIVFEVDDVSFDETGKSVEDTEPVGRVDVGSEIDEGLA